VGVIVQAAKELVEQRDRWLDEAVFTVYGWPSDLSDFFVNRESFMTSHDFEKLIKVNDGA
jgi:hypothetical protein